MRRQKVVYEHGWLVELLIVMFASIWITLGVVTLIVLAWAALAYIPGFPPTDSWGLWWVIPVWGIVVALTGLYIGTDDGKMVNNEDDHRYYKPEQRIHPASPEERRNLLEGRPPEYTAESLEQYWVKVVGTDDIQVMNHQWNIDEAGWVQGPIDRATGEILDPNEFERLYPGGLTEEEIESWTWDGASWGHRRE